MFAMFAAQCISFAVYLSLFAALSDAIVCSRESSSKNVICVTLFLASGCQFTFCFLCGCSDAVRNITDVQGLSK